MDVCWKWTQETPNRRFTTWPLSCKCGLKSVFSGWTTQLARFKGFKRAVMLPKIISHKCSQTSARDNKNFNQKVIAGSLLWLNSYLHKINRSTVNLICTNPGNIQMVRPRVGICGLHTHVSLNLSSWFQKHLSSSQSTTRLSWRLARL